MKILLLGKDGQVGHALQRALQPLGEVIALGRNAADLQDLPELQTVLATHAPEIIVNAAAYTAVDRAESDAAAAFRVNAEAVGVLAAWARDSGALLVHYSTDYVFDGSKATAYAETDAPNPQSVYGKSKHAGEIAIQRSGCNALIFRTSWVFSAHGSNFIKTILRLAAERDSLNVVADQQGTPTSAELIADVTALAIPGYFSGALRPGIYHLTAAGNTTWHEFARHVVARARDNGAALRLDPRQIRAITTAEYPLPAKRPANSCLDTRTLRDALGLSLPDWTIHVNRTVDQLTRRE